MAHYIIEVALWSLGLFLLGCIIGAVARHLFGTGENKPPQAEAVDTAAEAEKV